jgi:hypothetical protein
MDGGMDHLIAAGGILGIVLAILLILAAILWMFLPFAVFGVKRRLDLIIAHQRKTNELLEALNTKLLPAAPGRAKATIRELSRA